MLQNACNIDAATIPLSQIDVSNPKLYADDTWGQLFARLRREAPVHYCCKSAYGPFWSVTRYNDIMAVELDHATFSSSSEHGGIQIADLPPGAQYGNFIRMDPPSSHGAAQDRGTNRDAYPRRQARGSDSRTHGQSSR